MVSAAVWADGGEGYWAFGSSDNGKESTMNTKHTDPPYFPLSAKTESPPLNFLAGGKPPEEWDGPSRLSARGRTRVAGCGGTEKDATGDEMGPDGGTKTVGVGWRE